MTTVRILLYIDLYLIHSTYSSYDRNDNNYGKDCVQMYKIQIKHDGKWLSGLQYPEHKLVECLEKIQRLEQEGKEVRFLIVGEKIQ